MDSCTVNSHSFSRGYQEPRDRTLRWSFQHRNLLHQPQHSAQHRRNPQAYSLRIKIRLHPPQALYSAVG